MAVAKTAGCIRGVGSTAASLIRQEGFADSSPSAAHRELQHTRWVSSYHILQPSVNNLLPAHLALPALCQGGRCFYPHLRVSSTRNNRGFSPLRIPARPGLKRPGATAAQPPCRMAVRRHCPPWRGGNLPFVFGEAGDQPSRQSIVAALFSPRVSEVLRTVNEPSRPWSRRTTTQAAFAAGAVAPLLATSRVLPLHRRSRLCWRTRWCPSARRIFGARGSASTAGLVASGQRSQRRTS